MLTVGNRGAVPDRAEGSSGLARGAGRDRARAARPRVAILSTWHPEPVDNGRKQRTRQMIAALAADYDIALLSLLPAREIAAGVPSPVPGVWRQWALPLPEFAPRSLPALVAGLHPLPRSVAATWRPAIAAQAARILREARVELAIGTDLRTLRFLLALDPGTRALLDEPDVSPFAATTIGAAQGLDRLRALSRHRKYRRLLHRAAPRLDAAIAASAEEAAAYRAMSGSSRVVVIENGAATLPEVPWRVPAGARLLYAGSPTYAPNAEAVAFFARSILPLVEREVPEVGLWVTGAKPATTPPGLDHPRVMLTGRLDDAELDAAYHASRACIVPLLSGTGTRIKLLEAMAIGIPVVSTTKGAEGLDLMPGEDYLRADTPDDFAAATARLIRDGAFAQALGTRGRERVGRDYTWESRGRQLRELVGDCLAGR